MASDEEDCIKALQEAFEILGETPSVSQYVELNLSPSKSTICRVFDGWNDAKEVAGLEQLTNGDRTTNPVKPKPDEIKLPEGTEWSDLSAYQRYYYRNYESERERLKRNNKERRASLREGYNEWRRKQSCERCGEENRACIQFHHTEGMQHKGLYEMIESGYSLDAVKKFAEEGKFLCANCHRKEHWDKNQEVFVGR